MTFEEVRAKLLEEQTGAREGLSVPWHVPGGLRAKVSAEGAFLPLEGDTILFRLGPKELENLSSLRDQLTRGLEHLFSEPLRTEDLHLTLHDLSIPSSESNREKAHAILGRLPVGKVQVEPVRIFPCLNISVLAGFAPVKAADYKRLMGWYDAFDRVVKLDYWLRPHVTLAYFRPRDYTAHEVALLRARMESLPAPGPLELDIQRLGYERFTDMNHYSGAV